MWIDKYKPQTLDNYIGNKNNIELIKSWIQNFDNEIKKACIIIGNSGSGKTILAQLLLKHYNYNIKEINSNEIKSKKSVTNILYKTLMHKNILEMFYYKLKNGILIDELESILNGSDKTGLSEIINILKNNVIENPIIFTLLSNVTDKKLTELKKHCLVINLELLTKDEYYELIDYICKKEKVKITKTIKNSFIKDSKADIRRLINLIEDYSYNKKPIIGSKNNDFFIDKCIYDILTEKLDINTLLNYYEFDSYLLPLYLFENFPNILIHYSKSNMKNNLILSNKIIYSIMYHDHYYNTIFDNQNWDSLEIIGIFGSVLPNYYLSKIKVKNYSKPILYATLFNKLSLKFSNKKNINEYLYNNISINKENIFYIISLFQYCIDINDAKEFVHNMNYYNFDIKNIESLFKISKYFIKNPSKKFTVKFKNSVKKLCS